ncbi:MAG: hypothetical protein SGJ18_12135 [Pseudomonadota bacterium]|nr:hypothetical protein [Pseudomonadota bacterium]
MGFRFVFLFFLLVSVMASAAPPTELSAKVANTILSDWFPEGNFAGLAPNGNKCEILVNDDVNGEANTINFTVLEWRNRQNYHDNFVIADAISKAEILGWANSKQKLSVETYIAKEKKTVNLNIKKYSANDKENSRYEVNLQVRSPDKNFEATCISSPAKPSSLHESAPAGLAPSNVQSLEAPVREVKNIVSRLCELILLDDDENKELLPEIKEALQAKGFKLSYAPAEGFKSKNMALGDLWAYSYLYYNGERQSGTPLTQSKYWRARLMIQMGADNRSHADIVKDIDVYDFGIFWASKETAVGRLIDQIPTCEITR